MFAIREGIDDDDGSYNLQSWTSPSQKKKNKRHKIGTGDNSSDLVISTNSSNKLKKYWNLG